MSQLNDFLADHRRLTRRWFIRLSAGGICALGAWPRAIADQELTPDCARACAEALKGLEYLTPADKFVTVSRGNPWPSKLPLEKKREVGLTPETWRLEVMPDPATKAVVESPLSKAKGNALDYAGLLELAKSHAVSVPKIMTCMQSSAPEVRDIIERKVADAVSFPWGSLVLFGIDKVTKYASERIVFDRAGYLYHGRVAAHLLEVLAHVTCLCLPVCGGQQALHCAHQCLCIASGSLG